MLCRVLWFVATRPANSTKLLPLKVIWGALIAGVELMFILAAGLACRQFGWRLYSRLGVDYRQKGADKLQRLALLAHSFNALVKLDFIFLVTVTALGVDVAIEHRDYPDVAILAVSIVNFFLAAFIAIWGVIVASTASPDLQHRRLLVFDLLAPLSFAGPIALIVIYSFDTVDVANALLSVSIACSVFIGVRAALWATLHAVVRNTTAMTFSSGRMVVRASSNRFGIDRSGGGGGGGSTASGGGHPPPNSATLLTALQEGSWLGKPAPRNLKKIRFFQLSHDGSTLRWGWRKFVRLYYVQDVLSSLDSLTLTLTFVLDPELTLKFPDRGTMEVWTRGIQHAMVLLLRPDAQGSAELHSVPPGRGKTDSGEKGDGRAGRTGRGEGNWQSKKSTLPGAGGTSVKGNVDGVNNKDVDDDDDNDDDDTVAALEEGMLRMLGMTVRRMSRNFSRPSTSPYTIDKQLHNEKTPQGGNINTPPPSTSSAAAAVTIRKREEEEDPSTPENTATNASDLEPRPASVGQMLKRQRMAAFLAAASAATVGRLHSNNSATTTTTTTNNPLSSKSRPRRGSPGGQSRWFSSSSRQQQQQQQQRHQQQRRRPIVMMNDNDQDSVYDDEFDDDYLNTEEVRREKRRRQQQQQKRGAVQMVTIGTQTDDAEIVLGVKENNDRVAGDANTPDGDLASEYAALMAAAASAGGTGTGYNGRSGATGNQGLGFGSGSTPPPPPNAAASRGGGSCNFGGGGGGAGFVTSHTSVGTSSAETPPPPPLLSRGLSFSGMASPSSATATPNNIQFSPSHPPPHHPPPLSPPSPLFASFPGLGARSLSSPTSPLSLSPAISFGNPNNPNYNNNTTAAPNSPPPLAISVDVIDFDELLMGKLLGTGSEGAVYAAWYLETPVAVKRFNRVEDSLHEVGMFLGIGSHDNVVALRALCQHEGAMHVVLEYCPRGTLDSMLHHSAPQQWNPARLVPLVRSIARGMHHLHSRGIVHRDLKPAYVIFLILGRLLSNGFGFYLFFLPTYNHPICRNIFIGHGQTMKVGDFGMARYIGSSAAAAGAAFSSSTSPNGGQTAASSLMRLSPGIIGTTQYAAPELINESLRPDGTLD